jgi:hypothetical protein
MTLLVFSGGLIYKEVSGNAAIIFRQALAKGVLKVGVPRRA